MLSRSVLIKVGAAIDGRAVNKGMNDAHEEKELGEEDEIDLTEGRRRRLFWGGWGWRQ